VLEQYTNTKHHYLHQPLRLNQRPGSGGPTYLAHRAEEQGCEQNFDKRIGSEINPEYSSRDR
jgi:hypothetical protein